MYKKYLSYLSFVNKVIINAAGLFPILEYNQKLDGWKAWDQG